MTALHSQLGLNQPAFKCDLSTLRVRSPQHSLDSSTQLEESKSNSVNILTCSILDSRFLLLRIYTDSPVHMSANTEGIQICPVMLYIYLSKCIYTVI